jgi:hypothetical protein
MPGALRGMGETPRRPHLRLGFLFERGGLDAI